MTHDIIQALDAVALRVMAIAAQDAELRFHLSALAQAILSATAEPPSVFPIQTEVVVERAQPLPDEVVPPPLPEPVRHFNPPTVASVPVPGEAPWLQEHSSTGVAPSPTAEVSVRPRYPTLTPSSEIDLSLVEARCRLKAEGARWTVTRRRRLAEGADFKIEIAPHDRDIIARAKELPDCFLWMNQPTLQPVDQALLEDVAGCFEALAHALALLQSVVADLANNQDAFKQALDLTAEAQSALRASVSRFEARQDNDQLQAFVWLKATATERQVFIRRFMRTDDAADPSKWSTLIAKINTWSRQLEDTRKLARSRKKLFGKARHITQRITGSESTNQQDHWKTLVATVEELVQSGAPPSNVEIRELLLPVIDDMPELPDLPRGFLLVLREIDRYLADRPPAPGAAVAPDPTPAVAQVARLLGGKCAVLIGGERRSDALDALKTAFGLEELYWIETEEHQSLDGFEDQVARPEVAIVLLAIRWSSHSFGAVRHFCERHGKPLVRLPAGYHPNQVAYQILAQCSERLT